MNFKAKQNLNPSPQLNNNVIRINRRITTHLGRGLGIAIALPEQGLLLLQLIQPVWAGILFPHLKKPYDRLERLCMYGTETYADLLSSSK